MGQIVSARLVLSRFHLFLNSKGLVCIMLSSLSKFLITARLCCFTSLTHYVRDTKMNGLLCCVQ